jgi:hypothetical protein
MAWTERDEMDAKVRRQVEMGKRALLFCREHPDPSRGYQTSVGRLAGLVERAEELLRQQQQGVIEVHAAGRSGPFVRLPVRCLPTLRNTRSYWGATASMTLWFRTWQRVSQSLTPPRG